MKKYIALAVAIVVLGGGAFLSQRFFFESFVKPSASSLSFTATTTSTVLHTMNSLAAENEFSFSGRDFPGLGFFVEEINGKKNENGYYWFLYVNGVSSETGASQTRVHEGERIEWRYEKSH